MNPLHRLSFAAGRRFAAVVAIATALAGGLFAAVTPQVALAAPASIFVYDGNSALDQGFTKFGTAAGRPVSHSATLPADLLPFACVVLPINILAFTAGQIATFHTYVNGGGTLVALGERSTFAGANTNMNAVSTDLASGMQIVGDNLAGTSSTNIVAGPFTAGVTSYGYNRSSHLSILGSPGQALVNNTGGGSQPPVLGAAVVGQGVFVLSGDSNSFSDSDPPGAYANNSNGILAANLCAPRSTRTAVTCPALNAGQAVTCSVTVTDTKVAGQETSPSGAVSFASSGGGTFANGGTCTLTATSTQGQSSCTISFTPRSGGNVTATYAGDVRHAGSNAVLAAAVTASPVPTLPQAGTIPVGDPATGGTVAVLLLVLGAAGATGMATYRGRRVRR